MADSVPLFVQLYRLIDPSAADLGSDAVLLGRFVDCRDQAAFAVLSARHGPMVLRLCRRVLGDAHAAEDVCQAVFLVLARKANRIRHPETLAAWLHGVAYRLALKARAAQVRRQQVETRSCQINPSPSSLDPLAEVSGREVLAILDAELQRLPERYRLPLILCGLEGRSQPEAARLLGWTPGSVKGRLERGRAKLHQRLLQRGLTLSAALLALEASRDALSARLPALLSAAILRIASKTESAGGISASVLALVEGSIGGMASVKLKLVSALLLMVGVVAASFGTLAHPRLAVQQQKEKQTTEPTPTAKQSAQPRSPKEKPLARTDRYGDALPPGALARLGTIRLRRGMDVYPLPDADTFLSVSPEDENTAVGVWRMSTGALLRRLELPLRRFDAVVTSDGKTLAISGRDRRGGTNRVAFWDVFSGKETGELTGAGVVLALAFTPDCKTLATSGEGQSLRLWDWKSGNELRSFKGAKTNCYRLAFSPNGKILASACVQRRTVQLWDTATGRELHALGDGPGRRSTVCFSPDGKTVATADHDDKTIRLWDMATGGELQKLTSALGVSSLAFSPDGKTLAAGCTPKPGVVMEAASPIHLWDVGSGKEVQRLTGHVFTVSSLAFSVDGKRLVSGSSSSVLRVWDVAAGKDAVPFAEHESWVMSVAFSPDGRFAATGSLDGTIRLWEPTTGKSVRVFEGRAQPQVVHIAFSPDGRTLISDRPDGALCVWDVATGRQTRKFKSEGYTYPFAYSPDGRTLAVWHHDATVRLLDAATGAERRKLSGGGSGAYLCFSLDGRKLASLSRGLGRSGVLQVWDAVSGTEQHKRTVVQVGPIVFSPDGRSLIGASGDDTLPTGTIQRSFYLWDVATGAERPFVCPQYSRVFSLATSPDGRMLAWGDTAGTITLWDLAAGQVRRRLKGHHSYVESLAFSPDGKTLASGSADTTALVWDATGLPTTIHAGPMTPERLLSLWTDLASKDAAKAFDAIGLLTASPELAVPLLKSKLRAAPASVERRQAARLLADLDSDEFAVREKAMEQLRQLGERAEPALTETLKNKPALEARKRIEDLLERIRTLSTSPERLRELRAVEALEHIGTPNARQVLQTLADGAAHARLTREAKTTLTRLDTRPTPP